MEHKKCPLDGEDAQRQAVPAQAATARFHQVGDSGDQMVKHAVAATVIGLGAVSGAWAQSSVMLYGSMDAGVAYVNNVGGHAKWAMIQGNTQPDRWGLKGKE